jgi:hypothetical protein
VKLEELKRIARWAEKIAVAGRQLADDLAAEVAKAEARHDPLALHIFRARSNYRRVADNDRTKSAKHTELHLESTYREAVALGYPCRFPAWVQLMRSGHIGSESTDNRQGTNPVGTRSPTI